MNIFNPLVYSSKTFLKKGSPVFNWFSEDPFLVFNSLHKCMEKWTICNSDHKKTQIISKIQQIQKKKQVLQQKIQHSFGAGRQKDSPEICRKRKQRREVSSWNFLKNSKN